MGQLALMANIYSLASMGQKAKNIKAMSISNIEWKKPQHGLWIDSGNITHEFFVKDTKHA